jgi:hypothetical protein
MAVKPKHHKSKRRAMRRAVRGGISRLRKQILPAAQSQAGGASPASSNDLPHEAGVLRPDAASWRLPEGLAEAGDTESNGLMPGRVVIVITALALVFIAIITWFVSQMK